MDDFELPDAIIRGSTSARTIEEILRPREGRYEYMFKQGQKQLGYYYIPDFQRPLVWTDAQARAIVESVFLGISIGSIVVTDSGKVKVTHEDGRRVERFPDEADLLLDGQQRLSSLKRYIDNDLSVFIGTPYEHSFEQLSRRQQRRFLNNTMGYIVIDHATMDELKVIYDRLNFSGTAHEAHQRASTPEMAASLLKAKRHEA